MSPRNQAVEMQFYSEKKSSSNSVESEIGKSNKTISDGKDFRETFWNHAFSFEEIFHEKINVFYQFCLFLIYCLCFI